MKVRSRLSLGACAAVLSVLLVLWSCATNPVSGRREFSLVSPEQEVQIGHDGYPAVVQEYGNYTGQGLQDYVQALGMKLARVSHQPNLEWHFTVLDDPTVNAFAMPGGYIYVTRGIISYLNSEAQLAGVIGHEIGHVTARHSAQSITKQQLAGLGLGIASIFSASLRRYSDAAQTALQLMFLKYSRDNENEADDLGIQYATKAGFDPREVPATYVTLRRLGEKSGQRLPGFLSTHPDPGDRENRTRNLANAAAAGKTGLIVAGRPYLQRLDNVVFGSDPRQGYFAGDLFTHPEMGFEITFPSGWQKANSRSAVAAGDAGGTAQMQLTLADAGNLSPAAFVAELQRAGKIAASEGGSESIGGFPAWIGRLQVADQSGASRVLLAAFIRKGSSMFQILGASQNAAGENQIFASMRTFRGVPTRTDVTPDYVDVVEVARTGSFSQVVGGLGSQALDVEETSILNNAMPDEQVRAGQVVKVVRPGRH